MNARMRERDGYPVEGLRIPPQNIDAEQAVLGGLMLVPKKYDEVAALISEQSFYRRDHQIIWRAIKHLEGKGQTFDPVTVGEFFEANQLSHLVENGAYLIDLATTTPSAANILAYAEIVAEKARLRQVIEVGTNLIDEAFRPGARSSLEIIGSAQTQVSHLLSDQPCDLEPAGPVMLRVFDRLQDRYARGGGIDGMTTGLSELDELINGLKPGLYVLAARPKMGKTTLAQNIAEHLSLTLGKACAIFSFEMQPEELGDRMLSSIGGVDGDRVRRGTLDEADWANVNSAMRRLRGAPLFVSRPRNARVEHVVAQAKKMHAKQPLGLIVVDYLQLMEIDGDNRATGLGEISRALKMLSGEIGVPVLLLSQLNRSLEARTDRRPIPSDLRDSGAIEQDADVVIFIYRDEVYNRETRFKGTAELIVALQRNGPPGEVRVKYEPGHFRFSNLPFEWEPEPLPPKASSEKSPPRKPFGKRGNVAADAAAGDA